MGPLASEIIEAHGGLNKWRRHRSVSAHLTQGGALWGLKGKAGVLDDCWVTVSLTKEHASHAPFGGIAAASEFTPDRVTLMDGDRQTLEELRQPRDSFVGHVLATPWSNLQLAYFAGCAMWTYLNMPFLLAWPGVDSQEISPWDEGAGSWRRLRVRLPETVVSHSPVQTLYVDDAGLLKRHDYDVEIAGGTPGAHYISDYAQIDGIMVPTRRQIFPRQADGHSFPEPLVVSIDLDNIMFDRTSALIDV
ncbi:MAG: hypothetical protein KKB66_13400 [Alphaproteobacteria bacterium]|nr:hypothetical protein [Alphaproteobacteria bacterium]MBU0805403.1 hypothetical protein [Alphaproteobacteria bacterium]MBU0873349.1 hypothetical protein [Alphaproteobacteria bacterium]MBU1401423.1 hypothetical protein [Alphaproteobacteria bacterium]MBU1592160.1 hypothetical protein [Alphaproteobacteria bacterium]